jgi:hypothetical protein
MRNILLALLAMPCTGFAASRVRSPDGALLILRKPALVRSAPCMSLAIPVCTAGGVWSLAARAGCIGVAAQLGLQALFQRSSDPVLSEAPAYAAHQLIALLLMIFVSVLGLAGWLQPPATAATAVGRLLAPSNSARWLGAMLLGMLVAWDIPTSLAVSRLRKPDILTHHVAMAAVALVGATALPTHYGLYYMGVAELSSVPLTFYDQCEKSAEICTKSGDEERARKLRMLRDGARAVAAVAFILVRAFDFSRVTLSRFVPDALAVLKSTSTAACFRRPILFMLVSSVAFVGLQLYWLSLFVRVSLAEKKREAAKQARAQRTSKPADATMATGAEKADVEPEADA